MCRRHRKSTLEVSDIKKHHNVRYVSLHSRLSALQRILLIFPTECEASCKIPLLSPAEGVNELWMVLAIYGPIIPEMPTSWLCRWNGVVPVPECVTGLNCVKEMDVSLTWLLASEQGSEAEHIFECVYF